MVDVLAGGQVNGRSFRSANTVGADAENDGRAVLRFRYWKKGDQRMHLADLRIVFYTYVESRMQAVNQRRAHRCPIDLAGQQPNSGGEFLWVIGRPPDSLAFARSDRSGGNK